ncbi:MAG: efflux RND transporter periplasmic adaptor subunit [Sulfuricurvum sp.]|nr:efflux RND transporter periplasmic adaptor subunit [Sulfuricurvum sp.]MDP3023331.1 efflux RND transporter periplasmic adaptor subunit [Sulfuricurvum sp.]
MACCDKKRPILVGAVILIVIAYITSLLDTPSPKTAQVSSEKQTPSNQVNGVGTLEAKEVITISPKNASTVGTVYADEGDHVTKGARLAQMELSDLAGVQLQNSAMVEKSRSQMAAQKASIEDLSAKKTLADATLTRYKNLSKEGFVTQAELDTALASAKSANAALVSAQEALKQSQHEIQRAVGSLDSVNATIRDYSLRSPIDGIILSREAEAGSTIGAGTPVFKIANPKSVWVRAYIDERQSTGLKVGQSAIVTLRSTGEKKYPGIVRRIGVVSDRITEERLVYITLDTLPAPLYLGEQAEVQINRIHD